MSTNRHNRPRGSAARRVAGARNRPAAGDARSDANTTEHPAASSSSSGAEEAAAQDGAAAAGAVPEPHVTGAAREPHADESGATATDDTPAGGAAAEEDVAATDSGGAEAAGAETGAAAAETSRATGADNAGNAAGAGGTSSDPDAGSTAGTADAGSEDGADGAGADGTADGAAAGTARTLGSPSGKRRSVRAARRGTAGQHRKPESDPGGADSGGADSGGADTAQQSARAGRLARLRARPSPVLAVVTVIALAFAGWFGFETYSLRYSGAATNAALTDGATTSEVNGQITSAVEKVFSYDHNNVEASEKAADQLLTGSAVDTYNQLFGVVKEQAPKQQLVVTTSVRESAVTRLEGDQAEVLVFVDQRSMRAETGQSNSAPAQLSIGAHRDGDSWQINRITLR